MRFLELPRLGLLVLALALHLLTTPGVGLTQSFRYMDEAGNIHFVDDLTKVPIRYRKQIIKPTPTPFLNQRQLRALERQTARIQSMHLRAAELKKKQKGKKNKKVQLHTVLLYTSPTCAECLKLDRFMTSNHILFKRQDVLKSSKALQDFNDLNAGTELPVTKIGLQIVKGYKPELILELASSHGFVKIREPARKKGVPTPQKP